MTKVDYNDDPLAELMANARPAPKKEVACKPRESKRFDNYNWAFCPRHDPRDDRSSWGYETMEANWSYNCNAR